MHRNNLYNTTATFINFPVELVEDKEVEVEVEVGQMGTNRLEGQADLEVTNMHKPSTT
jgi:hypothetical protein